MQNKRFAEIFVEIHVPKSSREHVVSISGAPALATNLIGERVSSQKKRLTLRHKNAAEREAFRIANPS